jgi:hypothetical protein
MKFQIHKFYSLGEMALTKIKYENEQRAITKKIRSAEKYSCALHFRSLKEASIQSLESISLILTELCSGQS